MSKERFVEVVEVGPRDGLQNESVLVPTAAKVELVRRAVAAGARRVEVTAFVHPQRVPQMADAEDVVAALHGVDGVTYSALVLNERGLDRALRSGIREIHVVVVASDTFSRRNQGVSRDGMLRVVERIAARAHGEEVVLTVTVAAAFGCPFEGEVSPDLVGAIVARLAESEPSEIGLADTIGVGVPAQVRTFSALLRENAPGVRGRFHFHNTRNTGYANALAAVECGIDALDASTGGIGGCPFAPQATGNIATEDLHYLLSRSGYHTRLDSDALADTALFTQTLLGTQVPGQLSRAGGFRHN